MRTSPEPPPPSADAPVRHSRLEALWRDVRFGFRTLRRSTGYTCAAVGVLALGIGANTALFSVVRGVLLAPLPFANGDELMLVTQSAPASQVPDAGVSIPELGAYRERARSLTGLVEYHSMSFTLLKRGEPDRVDTGVVSANFFDVLGVRPLHGRGFVDADDDDGAEAVLLLSHRYWQDKFAGEASVVGQVVEMNNRPHTIVGVLPDFPQYPRDNDVYMPSSACPFRAQAGRTLPGGHRSFAALDVFGRLADGATVERARAEVTAIAGTFPRQHVEDYQRTAGFTGTVQPLRETLVADARPLLVALAGATMLVLLIACANVANLSLARTVRRSREIAVRSAVGASGGRILGQLLTESVLVGLLGGVFGVGLAWLTQGLLVSLVSRVTPRATEVSLDGSVLVFAFAVSLLTGLAFGAVPAFATRKSLAQTFREGSAGSGESAGRQRLRTALVVAQVAVSFVLLVGAALMLRSFQRLASVDLGYDAERVMTAAYFGNFTSFTPEDTLRINAEILERVRNAPGVTAAAVTTAVPLSNISPGVVTLRLDDGGPDGGRTLQADPNIASEGYFETLGVKLLAGRSFRVDDDTTRGGVAVVNASLAALLGGSNPVGSRFRIDGAQVPDGQDPWITVVGVVPDFHLYGPSTAVPPQYYVSFRQAGGFAGRLMARTEGDPRRLAGAMKDAVHSVDPDSPVEELATLAELHAGQLATPRVTALLMAAFAAVALLVTLAGIAGVIGTAVTQRTRELALRMALGASRGSVLRLVLGQGAVMVGVGLVLGVGGALAFSRLLDRYLFATPPTDPPSYLAVAVVFVVAGLLATFAPARRATAVAPQVAFRVE
jgi:putative ABC transport system permease protein